MALSVSVHGTDTIGLDEYIDYVRTSVDRRDIGSVLDSAGILRQLANDRELIARALNKQIGNFSLRPDSPSTQTLPLGRAEDFYVRANIWPSMADITSGRAYQDQFSYNLAHDHNFTFLTITYLGPGYETEIYEYDPELVQGYIGEPVDLRFQEKARLSPGVAMLYRASRDVHIQYPPPELTITLNLMIAEPNMHLRDQYCFDIARRTIASYPADLQTTGRASLVHLAGYLRNENTRQLLSDLAFDHPCRRTRLAAFESLARQKSEEAAAVWEKAVNDRSELVSRAARIHLGNLQNAKPYAAAEDHLET